MSKDKLKCKKCGLRFKDRKDPNQPLYDIDLCFDCRFVVDSIRSTIDIISRFAKANRDVSLDLDCVRIKKKVKRPKKDEPLTHSRSSKQVRPTPSLK